MTPRTVTGVDIHLARRAHELTERTMTQPINGDRDALRVLLALSTTERRGPRTRALDNLAAWVATRIYTSDTPTGAAARLHTLITQETARRPTGPEDAW